MTQFPVDDRDVDRILGAYSVPKTTPDFTARIVAEATRAGRGSIDSSRPVRTARRPWMRRSIVAGVIAINLFTASAIAAIIGGPALIHSVASFTHRLIAPTPVAPLPRRLPHPVVEQTAPRSLPANERPMPTPVRSAGTRQGLSTLPVIRRHDFHGVQPVRSAEAHRPVRLAVRRADRFKPAQANDMKQHRAVGRRFERHRNDKHLAPEREIPKDHAASADRPRTQDIGGEQERSRLVDERETLRRRQELRDPAEAQERGDGSAHNREPGGVEDRRSQRLERSARGGGKRRRGLGRRFGRRRG